jgi:hypothetical protein
MLFGRINDKIVELHLFTNSNLSFISRIYNDINIYFLLKQVFKDAGKNLHALNPHEQSLS